MKKNKKKLALTVVEIIVIALLGAALVFMFASYTNLKNSTSYSNLPELDFRSSVINSVRAEPSEDPLGILSPNFVGIVTEEKLTPTDTEVRRNLLSDIRPFLLSVFSDVSTILEFSSEDAKNEYIERSLYSRDEYLYMTFSGAIPASTVVPAISGETLDDIYHGFTVRELFIFCDRNGALSGAALDTNGNIATLTVRGRTSLSFDSLRAYESSEGMSKFEFLSYGTRKYPVMSSSVSINNISAYNNSGDFLTNGSENAADILEAFGFNPNGTRLYHTGERSVTYVEDIGELRIYANGDTVYSETAGGIELSALTGIQKDIYSFEDKISAAYGILTALDRNYFGSYAGLYLSSAAYDEENALLSLSFTYCADGIPLSQAGESHDAELVFGESKLVSANVKARSFALLESTFSDIPQKLLFVFSSRNFAENAHAPSSFIPVYTKNENSEVYSAKYAFLYDSSYGASDSETYVGEAEE